MSDFEDTQSFGIRMRRSIHQQPMVFFLAAAVLGILVDHVAGPAASVGWCVIGSTSFFISPKTRQHGPSIMISAVTLVSAVFGLNHRLQDTHYEAAGILRHVGPRNQPAIIEGIIASTPRLRSHPLVDQQIARGESPWQTSFEVHVERFQVGETLQPMSGWIEAVVSGRCDHQLPGDQVRLYGEIHTARLPSNPGNRGRAASYRQKGIHARMEIDRVTQVEILPNRGSPLSGGLNWHRPIAAIATGAREILLDQIGQDSGPLAVALVTGQRDFVDRRTSDLLLITGTAHLLSVSGMHLAIVVTLATYFCLILRLPTVFRVFFIVGVCIFYTAITGGRPPVLRAAILVTVFLVAILIRRPSQPLNTLAFAGLLLLAGNPENAFAIGVQLSFLAVATLLVASGKVGHSAHSLAQQNRIDVEEHFDALLMTTRWRVLHWMRSFGHWVKMLLWLSFCVTAISLPLVWYEFHVVSPISVFTNVTLGPLLFVALGFGIITVICGMIHPILGMVPATMCGGTIWVMNQIIIFSGSISFGHAWLPAPPGVWVLIFYLVMAVLVLASPSVRRRLCPPKLLQLAWISAWILISLWMATRPADLPDDTLEVTFIDVGHGTCVVMRSGDEVWMYDCGRLGNAHGSSHQIDRALWSLGITRIDGLILSHADADHFNALPGLMRRFTIDQIMTPPDMLADPEPAVGNVSRQIDEMGITVIEKHIGESIHIGQSRIAVLHPPQRRVPGSDNANSLVIQWEHAGRTLVLPGDLEPPGTEILMGVDRPKPGGILMAPHHGSLHMKADAILHWARPSQTIVSGGRLAKRPEVSQMLEQFGSDVHVTALSGAIQVRISGSGICETRTWLESSW